MKNIYVCPKCKESLNSNSNCCGIKFEIDVDKIIYDHDSLLFANFKKDYLLNKVLNNNGYLSYITLKEGSISLENRDDVKSFSSYIEKNYKEGNVIDIGCGPMDFPGYLKSISESKSIFFGLDPILETNFKYNKVIGCAEYIPFEDCFFDSIIFATSIDHVCNLEKTLNETNRVLQKDGKVILWHSCPKQPMLMRFLRDLFHSLKGRYNAFKYKIYSKENVVFYVPKGAVDPFHKEYIPLKKLLKLSEKNGLIADNIQKYDELSYFITLKKKK